MASTKEMSEHLKENRVGKICQGDVLSFRCTENILYHGETNVWLQCPVLFAQETNECKKYSNKLPIMISAD
jgi:hypothetical protein